MLFAEEDLGICFRSFEVIDKFLRGGFEVGWIGCLCHGVLVVVLDPSFIVRIVHLRVVAKLQRDSIWSIESVAIEAMV